MQCQDRVEVGKPFSLLASIALQRRASGAELEPFDVPWQGRDVLLVMYAPGLRGLGDQQQAVHVPANEDSRPVRFELRADAPGPLRVSVTAWIGGTYLGVVHVEVTADDARRAARTREFRSEVNP